ncbi:hypothetical protein GCM10020000_55830 [Streptomyces olivoverticillatus]
MSLFRDDGVVLRTQKLGEADRIITLLTRGHGRVRAVARGVRRTKSKFGARLEPFSHVDVQFFARGGELVGRGLPLCTQSETIAAYGGGIVTDYARYTAGTAMLETAERFTDHEGEPAVQQYLLLVGGAAHAGRGRARPAPGPRRLPVALACRQRLRAQLRRLREVRDARPQPVLLGRRRRRGVR